MGFLYSILGFLLAISVLVAVHEFGHYWVARKLGVKVLKFSIGFGKPLWTKTAGADNTEYTIGAIPLGGYVKMLGEHDPDAEIDQTELHRAFDRQALWKRTLIVFAGPAINLLFAILLFSILGTMEQQQLRPVLGEVPEQSIVAQAGVSEGDRLISIDGREVRHFSQHDLHIFNKVLQGENIELAYQPKAGEVTNVTLEVSNLPIYNISPSFLARTLGIMPPSPQIELRLARVLEGSAADLAQLKVNDLIMAVDGVKISEWQALVAIISRSADQNLLLDIERDGVVSRVQVTPTLNKVDGKEVGMLGISPTVLPYAESERVTIKRNAYQALLYGADQTWLMSSVTLRMLWKMVTLQVSHKNINGPIAIAQVAGDAIQVGLDYYLYVLAVISISLGLMNLLPIPMLDGGHLMMYGIEAVAGKSVSEKVFQASHGFGLLLLVGLMSLAFYNDIFRLLN